MIHGHHRSAAMTIKTSMAAATTLLMLAEFGSNAFATCKPSGFPTYVQGYSYCYVTDWLGVPTMDPFAASSGDPNGGRDSNWIYAPQHPPTDRPPTLLVFLPGHGSDADGYTEFMREAMAKGYYVIGLAYQNGKSIQSMCGSFADCPGEVLAQNVSFGVDNGFYRAVDGDPTPYPVVDNSISRRLGAILAKLSSAGIANGFNWRQFYNYADNEVVWSKVVIAGHSEGGATATWIVKNRPVIAGLVFESPYSVLNNDAGGVPDAGSAFTPYPHLFEPIPPAHQDQAASYLHNDSSNWVNRLYITLNKYDRGFDNVPTSVYFSAGNDGVCTSSATDEICYPDGSCHCTIPTWPGVNMTAAGLALGKTESWMSSAPAALNGHKWWTSEVQPTGGCTGHGATVADGCFPSWMPAYWDLLLDAVRPPASP
jgi:pimeloyl-ACP methyl ester carboxylesterase